jgi:hypothetical protein
MTIKRMYPSLAFPLLMYPSLACPLVVFRSLIFPSLSLCNGSSVDSSNSRANAARGLRNGRTNASRGVQRLPATRGEQITDPCRAPGSRPDGVKPGHTPLRSVKAAAQQSGPLHSRAVRCTAERSVARQGRQLRQPLRYRLSAVVVGYWILVSS